MRPVDFRILTYLISHGSQAPSGCNSPTSLQCILPSLSDPGNQGYSGNSHTQFLRDNRRILIKLNNLTVMSVSRDRIGRF